MLQGNACLEKSFSINEQKKNAGKKGREIVKKLRML